MLKNLMERIKIRLALRFHKSFRFRTWIELEEIKYKIVEAVREKSHTFPELVYSYISTAFHIRKEYLKNRPWEEVIGLFVFISSKTVPSQNLPFVSKPSNTKKDKDDWDYEGRTWSLYSHLLATTYGWNLEYIAQLDVDQALSLIQEILTDEQLKKEFIWSTSEKSVSYNVKTKTAHYVHLPRPYWMKPEPKPVKLTTMPSSLLPIGVIDETAIPQELKAKAIKSGGNLEGL